MMTALLAMWSVLVLAPAIPQRAPLSLQTTAPEAAPAPQLSFQLGGGLHLGQGAGVLDLHLGWRFGSWELGLMAENVVDLAGWDVQRDERALFALSSWRESAAAADRVLEPRNPRNVMLFAALSF
jgi:hypothetical protein